MKNKYILLLLFLATSMAANAQNVGVGIAAPNDLLHVSGTAAQGILFNNATTGSALTNGLRITIDATKNVLFNQQETAEMQFFTANTTRMRIDATGHVAINAAPIATEQLYVQGSNAAGTIASVNVNSAVNSAGVVGVGNTGVSTLPGATAFGVMGDVGVGNTNVGVAGFLGTPVNMSASQAAGVYGAVNNLSSGVGVYGLAQAAKVNVAGYFTAAGGVTSNTGIQSAVTGTGTNNYGFNGSVSGAGTNNFGGLFTVSAGTSANYGIQSLVTGVATNNYGVYATATGAASGINNIAGYFSASGASGAGLNYGVDVASGDVLVGKLAGGASVNVAGTNPYSLMVADATGLVGKIITSFPPAGSSLELWERPASASYIRPVSNGQIQVWDANQQYGFYYDGSTNDIGGYFVTTGIPAGYTHTAGVESYSNITSATSTAYLSYYGTGAGVINLGSLGTVQGAGIYCNTPDPTRPAGLFTTNTNANYAADIDYSSDWTGHLSQVDYSTTGNSLGGPYAIAGNLTITVGGYNGQTTNQIIGNLLGINRGTLAGHTPLCIGVDGQSLAQNASSIGVEGASFSDYGTTTGMSFGGEFFGGTYAGSGIVAYVGGYQAGTAYKIVGGGTVAEVIPTADHGRITLDAPEAPDYYYQDYGTVQLMNGKAHVDLDPILAEIIVVDKDNPLRVITQCNIEDAYGVAVVNKTATGFDLVELGKGHHTGEIDYEIIAKTKTNNGKGRFSQGPGPVGAPVDIPSALTANQSRNIFHWPSDQEVYNYTLKPAQMTTNKDANKSPH